MSAGPREEAARLLVQNRRSPLGPSDVTRARAVIAGGSCDIARAVLAGDRSIQALSDPGPGMPSCEFCDLVWVVLFPPDVASSAG